MDSKTEDARLWKKIKAGDETAFKQLFKKHYKNLTYRAYKVLADEHIAKDNVQEVFLDLWNKRDTKIINTSVHAYLSKAVTFKTIDYIRSRRFDFDKEDAWEDASVEPYETIEGKELAQIIHKAAQSLPERCRIIFLMSRFEDLSHKEIAEQLGISTKTVENQITTALKRMRKIISPYLSKDFLIFLIFLLLI